MSLSSEIAALATAVDSAERRISEDVIHLTEQVAALQLKVDAGLASPEDLEALRAIKNRIDAIDPDPLFPPVVAPI